MRLYTKKLMALFFFILILLLVPTRSSTEDTEVRIWLTTPDQKHLLTPQHHKFFSNRQNGTNPVIAVDEKKEYQEMDGFGAAATGSSAYLINQKMTADQRENLLTDVFTSQGIHMSYVRHTIGASDFSVDQNGNPSSYTYDDIDSGTDYNLRAFSVAKDQDVMKLLKAIKKKNKEVGILGTPWTAPAWMKYDTPTTNGWYLDYTDKKVYQAYANYFVKYIKAYKKAGIPVNAITVQNEPGFTSPSYPSMSMGAEEQAMFIRDYLGPAFAKHEISTKIIAYDHNWKNGLSYASEILKDHEASTYTDGTAFHCYNGTPQAMSDVQQAFPEKNIYFTECSGGKWSTDFGENLSWYMSNVIIGAPRNWAKTVLLWNLALDPNSAPFNGGCDNCRGMLTIDPDSGRYTKNTEYYAVGHISKFVRPGAVRIGSTEDKEIETVAFKNPDHSIVLVAANTGHEPRFFTVKQDSKTFQYKLMGKSAVTFTWKPGL
ncbi:glycoside hydrolase family 30 protein [Fictibacillus fluitans]|uniref:Glycoside hydrolase family 30 beta sandwich domain-containing protein n=1 Tax=Fictibacillus fluitans TaxID=3058422 RepID=A0ABT8HYF7_9BACL|nr:glycoside hydrolase family 30 beta sandwich domain-containing protein [Fictibacillus sp. NE201]MDN4525809.1 glycoside hydrolase family 30 beta sandwich domain-containing protein [Fictibacillus sp. NE201]